MVSKLRCRKETYDHTIVGTMIRVMEKGFKFLGNLTTSIKNFILEIISKLVKNEIAKSMFAALFDTFKDENVWVIDSDTS